MLDSRPSDLADRPLPWLTSPGEHDGIVISSRVRLARNLAGWPFRSRMDTAQQQDLVNLLVGRITTLTDWRDAHRWYLQALAPEERRMLVERHLVSQQMADDQHPAATVVQDDETAALMVNEEDHLRIQTLRPGLAATDCLASAIALDRALEASCTWAVHDRWGYLTACPTNTGTGLRVSVMLHLPALTQTKELGKGLRALSKLAMTVRGLYGEGSEATGHLYQISNQQTLGRDEESICAELGDAVANLIAWERLARKRLLRELDVRDLIHRAVGILEHAQRLSSQELIDCWSWIRLGLAGGILTTPDWSLLDRLFAAGQPAHLLGTDPLAEDSSQRDVLRARLVARALGACNG